MYGFIVRPQHLEKYLEYDKIYKVGLGLGLGLGLGIS